MNSYIVFRKRLVSKRLSSLINYLHITLQCVYLAFGTLSPSACSLLLLFSINIFIHFMFWPIGHLQEHKLVLHVGSLHGSCYCLVFFMFILLSHACVLLSWVLADEFTLVPVWGSHTYVRVAESDALCLVFNHRVSDPTLLRTKTDPVTETSCFFVFRILDCGRSPETQ
jgi:hypothetical protein